MTIGELVIMLDRVRQAKNDLNREEGRKARGKQNELSTEAQTRLDQLLAVDVSDPFDVSFLDGLDVYLKKQQRGG